MEDKRGQDDMQPADGEHCGLASVAGSALTKAAANGELDSLIKPLTQEIHLFDTSISGTSRIQDKSVFEHLQVGSRLTLLREESKFDDNAIAVLNENKEKVGYIPEKDNVIFARLMDAGKMLIAKVASIEIKGSFIKVDVGVWMVDF